MKKSFENALKTLIVAFITSEMTIDKKDSMVKYGETDANIDNVIEESGVLLYEEIIDHFKTETSMVTLVGDSCTINIPNRLVFTQEEIIEIFEKEIHNSTPTYTLLDILAIGER